MQKNLEYFARAIWKPIIREAVTDWAERSIVLSERTTNMPGPYSTALTPYVREPLNCFDDDAVHDLVLCWGGQTSKTTTIMVGVAFILDRCPGPTLWVMPTLDLARSFSETRWQPMVNDAEVLARHKPSDPDKFKLTEQHFDRMTLNFVGSNSPGNLSSRPVRVVIADETDKFKEATDKEAAAIQLADVRTKTYPNALRIKTSTPTTEHGTIWAEFLKGDRRYYFVPCPHCGVLDVLKWKNVCWDQDARDAQGKWLMDRVAKSAHYKCEHCSGVITDGHKTAMLRSGEWRPTNPDAQAGRRSYHLSGLYAPWVAFGDLACKFLQDKSSIFGLQDFVNSTLAETWEDRLGEEKEPMKLGEYLLGDGLDPATAFITADRQKDHLWAVCRTWTKEGASRLQWAGRLSTYEDIEELRQKTGLAPRRVLIDSGYETAEVYERCVQYGWTALKGEARDHYAHHVNGKTVKRIYSPQQWGDPGIGRADQGRRRCPFFLFASPTSKDILTRLMRGDLVKWEVARDVSEDYILQMNSETKILRHNKQTGMALYEWVRIGKRPNHLWDCECMQVVAAVMAGYLIRQEKSE